MEYVPLFSRTSDSVRNNALTAAPVVKYDLRSPSMFPGKKGFDRLVYAAKNVLNAPFTWLFCNLYTTSKSY